METFIAILLWYGSGLLAFPIFWWYWTDKFDLKAEDLFFFLALSWLGPLSIVAHGVTALGILADKIPVSDKVLFKSRGSR